MLVAKWLHWGGIPVNTSINNTYYQPMFDLTIRAGPRIKGPLSYVLVNILLVDVRKDLKVYIRYVMTKWVDYG